MRLLLLAATLALASSSASAQTTLAPSLGFTNAFAEEANGGGSSLAGGLYLGRPLGAFELGGIALIADVTDPGMTVQAAVGPRLTHARSDGAVERRFVLGATVSLGEAARPGGASGFQALSVETQASISREVRVAGLRLAPLVGGYAAACTSASEGLGVFAGCAEIGALLGAEIRFRAFGSDVAVPIVGRYGLAGNTLDADNGNYLFHQGLGMQSVRFQF